MVFTKENRRRNICLLWSLRLFTVFVFMQLVFLTVVNITKRPTFHFNPSLIGPGEPISSESKAKLYMWIRTFSNTYSYCTDCECSI